MLRVVYKCLWTAAQDYGLVVTPDKFAVGQYLFVDVGADAFRVPDTRGYFVRNTEATGRVDFSAQEDATRKITGRLNSAVFSSYLQEGCFVLNNLNATITLGNSGYTVRHETIGFDSSRVTPTADESRPKNTALPAWIRA